MKRESGRGRKNLRESLISYWAELLVFVLVCGLLLCDISRKEGYHMDELLSFELANAEFTPWIVPTQPQGRLEKFVENELRKDEHFWKNLTAVVKDVLQNRGNSLLLGYTADVYEEPVWITQGEFQDYVTVAPRDAFNYLSVYFNVKDDNHPPLHFMAVHTISSLAKGRLTPFMGCVINLVCVLGIMVLLMKIGYALMRDIGLERYGRVAGLAAAGLYGVSGGALSTVLLIRMYAMLTFWAVALFWVHLKKMEQSEGAQEGFAKGNGWLLAVTVLGFWTQYFFLFYCLILAAMTVVFLWRQKRMREVWCYLRTMSGAAVLGVAVFPFAIADVFSSGRGVEALNNLTSGFAGYGLRLMAFADILFKRIGLVGTVVFFAALLGWAMRLIRRFCVRGGGRTKEMKQDSVLEGIDGIRQIEKAECKESVERKRAGAPDRRCVWIWWYLGLPVLGYYLLASRMAPYLVDRYIMPLFPFFILFGVCGLITVGVPLRAKEGKEACVEETGHSREASAVLPGWGMGVVFLLIAVQFFCSGHTENFYYYKGYGEQLALSEKYRDLPCVCVYEGVGYYENLPEFMNYERTLLVTLDELAERREIASVSGNEAIAVLVKPDGDTGRDAAVRKVLEEKYDMRLAETLMKNGEAHGDSLYIFQSVGQ